ncbi:MAG: cobalt-precorrin-3B C(17)-methyltransferase, partial [Deltaproteobacteria bacterium]
KSIDQEMVDMKTILIIGSSKTKIYNGFMITPRGYAMMKNR